MSIRTRSVFALGSALIAGFLTIAGAHDGVNHSLVGEWTLLPDESDVLPVHAALLPDERGMVLIMAGSGNTPTFSRGINEVRLWDNDDVHGAPGYPAFAGDSVPAGAPATHHDNDIFCSGHVWLPNGKLFLAGGNLEYPTAHPAGGHPVHSTPATTPIYDSPEARPKCHDFLGLRDSFLYDPDTASWSRGPKMQRGRWYPSLLSLGDGRVLTISGLDDIGQGGFAGYFVDGEPCYWPVLNRSAEIYNPATNAWGAAVTPTTAAQINPDNLGLYPYLHLLPTGKVFLAGPTDATEVFDADTLVRDGAPKMQHRGGWRDYGFSTLLALRPSEGYRARVFNMGGGNNTGITNQTEIIDFSAADPQWTAAAPMPHGRSQGASVLLPDGTVFVMGGTSGLDNAHNAILEAEIYNPETNTWKSAGRSAIPRLYHTTAVVLPDGRVWVGGSNPHDTMDPNERQVETRIEIYKPPYLFVPNTVQADIPRHPDEIGYGSTFEIRMDTARAGNQAKQVVLLRLGSTTHTRNFDERLVELTFTQNPDFPRRLQVTGPPHANIAPPGNYMMFVISNKGVPSRGHSVKLR